MVAEEEESRQISYTGFIFSYNSSRTDDEDSKMNGGNDGEFVLHLAREEVQWGEEMHAVRSIYTSATTKKLYLTRELSDDSNRVKFTTSCYDIPHV